MDTWYTLSPCGDGEKEGGAAVVGGLDLAHPTSGWWLVGCRPRYPLFS